MEKKNQPTSAFNPQNADKSMVGSIQEVSEEAQMIQEIQVIKEQRGEGGVWS